MVGVCSHVRETLPLGLCMALVDGSFTYMFLYFLSNVSGKTLSTWDAICNARILHILLQKQVGPGGNVSDLYSEDAHFE
jgi:hypothetical protein